VSLFLFGVAKLATVSPPVMLHGEEHHGELSAVPAE
jgi:hypothetical protein